MARRRYLIAYDIADDKRLRRVAKVMEGYGTRLQYSVFLCDLSGMELVAWRTDILRVVKLTEDSIVSVDLGAMSRATPIKTLGTPRRLPQQRPQIV